MHKSFEKFYFPLVLAVVFVITVFLSTATYYINAWPTDSELAYIPSAAQLFNSPYLSQMHEATRFKILYGKEALILGIALMQRLLNDTTTLFPNVFLLILATGISGALIFLILKEWLHSHVALLGFILFITCFLPYQYILLGAHQPFVLMNFLLAIFFLMRAKSNSFYWLSGIFVGLMLFSSPTAPVYLPYYIAVYFAKEKAFWFKPPKRKKTIAHILILGAALVLIFLLFSLPHPLAYLKDYSNYINASKFVNNFTQPSQHFKETYPIPASLRGAGPLWILKYFFLAMPVLFVGYSLSLLYLFKAAFKGKNRSFLLIILLSLSTPILVETIQVAQLGRSYFSWIIGILGTLSLAVYHLFYLRKPPLTKSTAKYTLGLLGIFVFGHVVFNLHVFISDIFPSRMASNYIYAWFKGRPFANVFTYLEHPYNINLAAEMNNPKKTVKIFTLGVGSLRQAVDGYFFLPPITGKSIWRDCQLPDFTADPYVTKLYESGEFNKYVVASFKTVSSSKFWIQEEECCSYLDLGLGAVSEADRKKGYAWILDAAKLQKEWFPKHSQLK